MPDAPSEWTVLSMLEWATDYFEKKNVKSPRFSIEWLLADTLDIKRLDLYLSYNRPLSSAELQTLKPMVKRRAVHEPLQYITGSTDFYHCKIQVEPGVLIPRQETEQLIDLIVKEFKSRCQEPLKVLDIGTGSGCIPIALKKENPDWEVHATDISEEALRIAEKNAKANQTEIHFIKDDILRPLAFRDESKFDLIISNPPYILAEEKSTLDPEVVEYEPEGALFCTSIEEMYGAVESFAAQYLTKNGKLFLEMHELHSADIQEIFNRQDWSTEIKQDYGQKDRFLVAQL